MLLAGVAVLGTLAIPTTSMRLALPDDGTAPEGTSKREAFDLVAAGFGEGFNGRLVMVVHGEDAASVQQAVQQAGQVATGTTDVLAVAPGGTSADGRTALLAVVPTSGPTDERTFTLVRDLRDGLASAADATRHRHLGHRRHRRRRRRLRQAQGGPAGLPAASWSG